MDFGFPLMQDSNGNSVRRAGRDQDHRGRQLLNLNVHGNRSASGAVAGQHEFRRREQSESFCHCRITA